MLARDKNNDDNISICTGAVGNLQTAKKKEIKRGILRKKFFCDLTDGPTDKMFVENLLIDVRNLHKKSEFI